MKKIILIIVFAFAAWHHYYYISDAPKTGSGIYANVGPYQDVITNETFKVQENILTKRASFSLRAKVISAERYYLDKHAPLSSLDLVLGWGEMSDESVLEHIDISQSKRQYQWKADNSGLSAQEITLNSGNMHLIPANEDIGFTLKKIRNGNLIYIDGFLVDVKNDMDWIWKTSLSRSDKGEKSGEIIFVTTLEIIEPYEY